MSVEFEATANGTVVRPIGAFDGVAARRVRERLAQLGRNGTHVVVLDLADTTLIDSAGAGAVVFLKKRLSEHGQHLRVQGADGQPRETLEFLGIALEP